MRSNEERIAAMHQRADELTIQRNDRIAQIGRVAAMAACLAVVILIAVACSRIHAAGISVQADNFLASMFTDSGALGYIVIGIVGFLFGVFATAFCIYLGKYRKRKHGENDR